MANQKVRIVLIGVGGQGTLTATNILARSAMDAGLPVTAGEVHGMAQRGGVVESTVLIGGYTSPRVAKGEAHVLLGFEPMETYRALHYLAPGGTIVTSTEPIAPIGVSLGRDGYPDTAVMEAAGRDCAAAYIAVPALSLATQAGAVQAANMVLLGALAAIKVLPFGVDQLLATMRTALPPKLVPLNEKAVALGAEAAREVASA